MSRKEAESLKIGDSVHYQSSEDSGSGKITDKNWTGIQITYDDGLIALISFHEHEYIECLSKEWKNNPIPEFDI